MLKLKNVSKYYYNKGVVASGFTKVNLELDLGEFVVITGESGSGKSTLLNVISGLDTYEDGEMYINGVETSHYGENEFEEYRKKYIGNIFQNFNLVNSYSVYQNIELVLLLNGFKKKNIKERVLNIIDEVGLKKFKNTKCAKLSGGQKQRVAIARALAKDTSIIVADEPTGNLDSQAAKAVLKLLHEISKEKLIVIVTHNYEQIEEYATRKIKMHDGKILEDVKIKKIDSDAQAKTMEYQEINFFNKLRLGLRNTFNVKAKFFLVLFVFLFLTTSVIGEYSVIRKQRAEQEGLGMNSFFKNTEAERLLVQKKDLMAFTDEDYTIIGKIDNIKTIMKNDILLDSDVYLQGGNYYINGSIDLISKVDSLDVGRMPENDQEVVVVAAPYEYSLNNETDSVMNATFSLNFSKNGKKAIEKLKIVGVKFSEQTHNFCFGDCNLNKIFVNNSILTNLMKEQNALYTDVRMKINNKNYETGPAGPFNLISNSNVAAGKIYVPEDAQSMCKNYYCKNAKIKLIADNIYFEDEIDLQISQVYTTKNFKKLLGLTKIEDYYSVYFINPADYAKLFDKGTFQSSVFVADVHKIDQTIDELKNSNFVVLRVQETVVNPFMEDLQQLGDIFMLIFIVILTVGIFFVSYFIIKLILKSRNVYFSTIRILGSSKKVANQLLKIELFTVLNITYLIFITLVLLVQKELIIFDYIKDLSMYLKAIDYLILYLILFVISYLIANRYAKKLFTKSAMNTYREEV